MSDFRFVENDLGWPQQEDVGHPGTSQNDPNTFESSEVFHGDNALDVGQILAAKVDDLLDNVISISASGADVIVAVEQGVKQFVLDGFDEIRIIGGAAVDKLNIGSLFGTTIKQD